MVLTKKIASGAVLVCLFSLLTAGSALAAEVIGCVEFQKVMMQHPRFAQVQNQMKAASSKKESEAKAAFDKEKDDRKKAQVVQLKRRELAQEENSLIQPLYKDIDLAIRTVAKNKGITVVVEKDAVFVGGEDITQDVINQLKK
jgi:outer membrane protein